MVKISISKDSGFSVETEDFELQVCHAKMSRSLKNVAAYYIFNKAPEFYHLDDENKIDIVLPLHIKKIEGKKSDKHATRHRD